MTKSLTKTERRIVALVCEGLTNPQIADRLCVSPRTVQGHLLNVFKKLNVATRTQLVAKAVRAEMQERSDSADRVKSG